MGSSAGSVVYTVGHSTQAQGQLLALLAEFGIRLLADIRSFPASRRHPWFSREALEAAVTAAGIEYHWFRELGGYRRALRPDSPHTGLRVTGFRNYADHMSTSEFQLAPRELMSLAGARTTAYLCAERLYWRCHRMLLSDFLTVRGWQVLHILGSGQTRSHRLTAGAQVDAGQLVYHPVEEALFSG